MTLEEWMCLSLEFTGQLLTTRLISMVFVQQKITQLGVTPQQLQQMGQMMRVSGGEKTFKSTGNVQADALLMAMGLKPQ